MHGSSDDVAPEYTHLNTGSSEKPPALSVKKIKSRQQSVEEGRLLTTTIHELRTISGKNTGSSIQNEDMYEDDADLQVPMSVSLLSPHGQANGSSPDADPSPINT